MPVKEYTCSIDCSHSPWCLWCISDRSIHQHYIPLGIINFLRKIVVPPALIDARDRYSGSMLKMRRLQGALWVMRFDRSLNSFLERGAFGGRAGPTESLVHVEEEEE